MQIRVNRSFAPLTGCSRSSQLPLLVCLLFFTYAAMSQLSTLSIGLSIPTQIWPTRVNKQQASQSGVDAGNETASQTRTKASNTLTLAGWIGASPRRKCLSELEKARTVPHFLTNPEVQREHATRARCCLRRLRSEVPLELTRMDDADYSEYAQGLMPVRTMRDMFDGGFKSCAVVSSAPSLRWGQLGGNIAQEIDAAGAVFRFNKAPVRGFEEWVGSKETVRLINSQPSILGSKVLREAYNRSDRVIFIRDALYEKKGNKNMSLSWDVPVYGQKGTLSHYLAEKEQHPLAAIYLNHPVFSELSLRFLHRSLVGGNPRSLSTGAQGVILAMLLCDKVVSYEVTSRHELSKEWQYYYSTKKRDQGGAGYGWWHPFREEAELLEMLATKRRANSSIYEFDMVGSYRSAECRKYLED